jgi:hypothetical protein
MYEELNELLMFLSQNCSCFGFLLLVKKIREEGQVEELQYSEITIFSHLAEA